MNTKSMSLLGAAFVVLSGFVLARGLALGQDPGQGPADIGTPAEPDPIDGVRDTVASTAASLGLALTPQPGDADGIYEGFGFSIADYSALDGFGFAPASPAVDLFEDLVEWRADLVTPAGARISIGLVVAQDHPVTIRKYFANSLGQQWPTGSQPPALATGHGVSVGEVAVVAEQLPAADGFLGHIAFIRRNVLVRIVQPTSTVDAAALAREIDGAIQRRPLLHTLQASKLRPRITEFKMNGSRVGLAGILYGEARYTDPESRPLNTRLGVTLGDALVAGERVTYFARQAGIDTLTLVVANSLNLVAVEKRTVVVR